jgi:hypothetical protein
MLPYDRATIWAIAGSLVVLSEAATCLDWPHLQLVVVGDHLGVSENVSDRLVARICAMLAIRPARLPTLHVSPSSRVRDISWPAFYPIIIQSR